MNKDLRCTRLQILKGSPSYCWRQLHVGIWLMTVHSAFLPQIPIQGLIHLLFMQALLNGQSEFCTHSGLHSRYGSPWYSFIHSQSPLLHIAFDPHGDGLHGSGGSGGPTIEYWDIFICEKFFVNQLWKTHCKQILSLTYWNRNAIGKRISRIPIRTCTRWGVIDHSANSICSTRSRAWVLAFVSNTSFITYTIWVDWTFWMAIRRCTHVIL